MVGLWRAVAGRDSQQFAGLGARPLNNEVLGPNRAWLFMPVESPRANFLEGASPVAGLCEDMSSEAPAIHRAAMTATESVGAFSSIKHHHALVGDLSVPFGFDGDRVCAVAVMTVGDSIVASNGLA